MITLRPAASRGHTRFDWLDSWHTFSFGGYRDPQWMRFGPLRVINDDRVAPGGGFAPHSHQEAEIVTYVLDGLIEHQDSMGNITRIPAGDIQVMSAGRGVTHSEYNASKDDPLHFLQIWLLPTDLGEPPAYHQKAVPHTTGQWLPLVSYSGADGTLPIRVDASIALARLEPGQTVTANLEKGRGAWVHVATGAATLNGHALAAGDGAGIKDETAITLTATAPSQILLFDLPLD